jgi:hypothetical protein
MPDINFNNAEAEITKLAKDLFQEGSGQAISDGKAFLDGAKQKLLEYLTARDKGEITAEEFEDLARRDLPALATMEGLKQQGVNQVRIDRLTEGTVNILIKTALTAIV